ncbi:efflux RND transporter permease subunit [Alkalicoccus daliensis]|uniref:Hydrophobic/amphiphilic exporter-1, HAE1 family n=1 Tax=Alkalicoccus daliensis TaxID=745820 RepID=A0A1H0EWI9_9BACI|nr:efflux RND transporter permease subunit [Alkalicoccus daliensis]SDN86754.1 hydrophobic/amphiphilic exporter-1, HAE1 family [Alkalicoccus daliensis]
MKIWDFSIKRPKFTIVIMLVLLLLGTVSLTRLPIQLLPDVDAPVAAVVTSYPGAGPEEVLNEVTEEMEEDLSTISGLNQLTSQTTEGSSIVVMEFSANTSISDVENEIVTTINQTELPDGAGNPAFLQFDPSMFPSIQLAVSSDDESVTEFQEDVAELQRELSRIEGIASISESGTLTEQYEIVVDQEEMEAAGLTQDNIVETIQANDIVVPGGIITDEEEEESISTRLVSELNSPEEIEELVVTLDPETGDEILISDVADISLQTEEEEVITRINQESSIQLDVMLTSEADTTQASNDFNEELEELLEEDQYAHLEASILYDEGDVINQAVSSVVVALISGGILAMVVLFAFLRNLKTPLIIGIAIPFSIITTFALFFFTNITLNLMTLGGLALGIGMLVDNSIVVVENIYRHLSMKKSPRQAAAEGTKEVAGAITASTLTTASIFLPVVFITGFVGDIFAPLSITVAFSLFSSLFIAVTIVPMIASRILTAPDEDVEEKRKNSRFMRGIESASRWTLRRRAVVLIITLLTLVVGAFGLSTTGVEFIPDSDEGAFLISVEHEQGTILNRTEETIQLIEDELEEYDEIESYLSTIGSTMQQGGFTSQSHTAEIMVTLVDPGDRDTGTFEFIDEIDGDIEGLDEEADIEVQAFSQAGFGGDPNTHTFSILDPDTDRLTDTADEIVEALEEEDIIRSVTTSEEETAPEIQFTIDREAAQELGLAPAQIASSVNAATSGTMATTLQTEDNETYNVNVRYPLDVLGSVENFEAITIPVPEGEYVALSEVAEVEEGQAPAAINRADMVTSIDFTVLYDSDSDLSEAASVTDDVIEDIDLADEAEYSVGGDQAMLDDVIDDVFLAFMLGLAFIYLVMVAQFESFKYPFIIMFTVPLFIIGVMLALTVTQSPISVMAIIGVIVLAGIVVNNAIVLVDYINQQKEKGYPTADAIVMSVKDRTRPIIITALTTILGVVPLAIGIGEGAEIIQPMGIVIIGGLISSTLLTLFVIPVIYSFFDKTTRNMNKKYMTPDGQVIYQRDLPIGRETHEEQKSLDESTDDTNLPVKIETEDADKRDDAAFRRSDEEEFTKDEMVKILEGLLERSKKSNKDEDKKE